MNTREQIRLPLLQELVEGKRHGWITNPESVMVVMYQHYLRTTVDLVLSMVELGVPADQIYCCGKNYSYNEEVHQHLLAMGIKSYGCPVVEIPGTSRANMLRLMQHMLKVASEHCRTQRLATVVIISDGILAVEEAIDEDWGSAKLAGVLQTGSAHYSVGQLSKPIPLVDIAYSAAKSKLELPLIADLAVSVIQEIINNLQEVNSVGVVGMGNLGSNIFARMRAACPDLTISCHGSSADTGAHSFEKPFKQLLEYSDLIIGCCGRDVFVNQSGVVDDILRGKLGSKTFASVSSGDYEFLTLLRRGADAGGWRKIDQDNDEVHATLLYPSLNSKYGIRVIKGGYPINFNRTGTSLDERFVQLTRALLLAAFVQATNIARVCPEGEADPTKFVTVLDAQVQCEIVSAFFRIADPNNETFSAEIHDRFRDVTWVEQHSKYRYYEDKPVTDGATCSIQIGST